MDGYILQKEREETTIVKLSYVLKALLCIQLNVF